EYVQMGAELGFLSLVLFGWGLWVVGQHVRWILYQRLTRGQRSIVVGVTGASVALLTHAAVDSNLHEPALAIVVAFCVGMILACRRLCEQRHEQRHDVSSASRSTLQVKPIWGWVGAAVILASIVGIVRLGSAWMWYEKGDELHRAGSLTDAVQF